MKLASLKSGRDGRLVVVSDDLAWCADATHIAPTLQAALDGWRWIEPALRNLATDLAHSAIPKMRFHEREAASPMPRAYEWLLCPGDSGNSATQLQRGNSSAFAAPRDEIALSDGAADCDITVQAMIVTGDVAAGAGETDAPAHILLVGLAVQTKWPQSAGDLNALGSDAVGAEQPWRCSPVFVTPDALDNMWDGSRFSASISVDKNGGSLAPHAAGRVSATNFSQLVARAAKSLSLSAGTIISAEVARLNTGLTSSDTLRIWMDDARHKPIFGVIEQQVAG
jgi:fumarylacetoacetate (FAA) hydrolase